MGERWSAALNLPGMRPASQLAIAIFYGRKSSFDLPHTSNPCVEFEEVRGTRDISGIGNRGALVKLAGKVALVTGAGRGIGKVIAQRLAQEGASLVVHYGGSHTGANDVVREIRAKGVQAVALQADLTRRSAIVALFDDIDRECGRLDIVVNSAGTSEGTPLRALSEDTVESMV